jgi:hypothetical protein
MWEDSTSVIPSTSLSLHITMTEGDHLAKSIEAETVTGEANFRKSVVTFSDANPADGSTFKESVVTFCDANPGDAARSFGSISTTRTIVVDATQHLEAGSTASSKLIPGVNDMTKGVQDVVRNAKECVRMFRVDNEIFEVNEEQLNRVRMSKCDLDGVGDKTYGFGLWLTAPKDREKRLKLLEKCKSKVFFFLCFFSL